MSEPRNAGRPGSADVHVRISRLVVDREALGDAVGRGLREAIARGIADRLGPPAFDFPQSRKAGPHEDAIASAVAQHVSSRLNLARRR